MSYFFPLYPLCGGSDTDKKSDIFCFVRYNINMLRVGVIRGGISNEYDVSLKSGASVLSYLKNQPEKYKVHDILIAKNGQWHLGGIPTDGEKLMAKIDVFFNATHGEFGEDGTLSQLFENIKIPHTGSAPFPSFLASDKIKSKEIFKNLGIKTPNHILLPAYLSGMDGDREEFAVKKSKEVFSKLGPPWIVKPLNGGSSLGVRVVKTLPALVEALSEGFKEKTSLIVEELINGREASVVVARDFRGQKFYSFPEIEIKIPKEKNHYDFELKNNNFEIHICPSKIERSDKEKLANYAKKIHETMHLGHYSSVDFIVTKNKGIYAIEVDALPHLHEHSLLPKAVESVGSNMKDFVNHIVGLAINRK